MQAQNQYLHYLIDPSFQGVNRLFVLSFENSAHQTSYTQYFHPTVEIKDCNVMIDGEHFFDQLVKIYIRRNYNIKKIATGQGDDYNGCLLDYVYENYYKMIEIDVM